MIGCLRARVRKQPIIALYFESENVLRFYNLESCPIHAQAPTMKLFSNMCIFLVGNYLRPSRNSRQLIFNINDAVLIVIIF